MAALNPGLKKLMDEWLNEHPTDKCTLANGRTELLKEGRKAYPELEESKIDKKIGDYMSRNGCVFIFYKQRESGRE